MTEKAKRNVVDLLNLMEWIASRKMIETKHRSEHSTDIINITREILEHLDDKEYWKEEFYG